MDEPTKSFWWKIWGRPIRSSGLLTFLLLLVGLFLAKFYVNKFGVWQAEKTGAICLPIVAAATVLSALCLIFSFIRPTRPLMGWILRRWFFCAALLVTVVALFYAEENWRGKRAWERARHNIEASGVVLNWEQFIPPPVPDDQNIFKVPKMQEWFVFTNNKRSNSNELTAMLRSPTNFPIWGATNKIHTEAEARAFLTWSDQLKPQFDLIRDALKRPYARMEGDYSNPMDISIPNYIAIREVARKLAQRSDCFLILQQPDKAVNELALLHDLRHMLEASPSGKPMTLVAAMINVAVAGLYVEAIGDGFRLHAWREGELVDLEKQLSEMNVTIPVAEAFQSEPAATTHVLETVPISQILASVNSEKVSEGNILRIAPRGWVYQNMAQQSPFFYDRAKGLDPVGESVSPAVFRQTMARVDKFLSRKTPFNVFARIAIPNFVKAIQTTARNQNSVNEARVACALERYKLAHGQYPDSLDALVPQFIEKIPHDVINAGELKYHRSNDGFILYSVGWDEKDDGGATKLTKDGRADPASPDWVWEYSTR
jgi:hypothetical protein